MPRPTRRTFLQALSAAACAGVPAACGGAPAAVNEVRITKGAGGVGFLPLLVMEQHRLIQTHARVAGIKDLRVSWLPVGGPSVVNDLLLSDSVDFGAAGPPAFITLWSATRGFDDEVHGVAAITSLPMYLNTRTPRLKRLDDLTEQDKIAVTAIKVSIPSIIMQMYAKKKYGPSEASRFDKFTRPMTHSEAVGQLQDESGAITAHFASPPFHQLELQDKRIRTILTSDEVMGGSTTFTMLSAKNAFRKRNPAIYAAVLAALREANEMIRSDIRAAAELALGKGLVVLSAVGPSKRRFTVDEMVGVLEDPAITFATAPQNVMKYAEFMHGMGRIKNRPASWQDLFFPDIHAAPGS